MGRKPGLLLALLAALAVAAQAGHILPLHHRRAAPPQGRRLSGLRNASLPLQGSLREFGYFFATLQLGTPPRHFGVIVDTGARPESLARCTRARLGADGPGVLQAPLSPTSPAPAARPAATITRCLQ